MKTQPLKGMRDLLPREQALRDYIQGQILDTYRAAGFQRISTPILEDMENLDKSDGSGQLFAALENLEDQVQVVAAIGFVQVLHILQHGGGDALKAGSTVGLQDLALDVVAQGLLSGQQVAHALQCLCFHKMVPLYINQCKYFYLIHYKEICRFVN